MKNNDLQELKSRRPGDKVLRRTAIRKLGFRQIPDIPVVFRVLRDIVNRTPFVPMFLTLVTLWFLFALGMYLIERNADGEMTSYGTALWWALASVETMGTPYEPATTAGHILGGIWAVLGTLVFWGTIIASVTVYFTSRHKSHADRMIETIHYDLDELETLNMDELETLKYNTNRTIDHRIDKVKRDQKPNKKTENK